MRTRNTRSMPTCIPPPPCNPDPLTAEICCSLKVVAPWEAAPPSGAEGLPTTSGSPHCPRKSLQQPSRHPRCRRHPRAGDLVPARGWRLAAQRSAALRCGRSRREASAARGASSGSSRARQTRCSAGIEVRPGASRAPARSLARCSTVPCSTRGPRWRREPARGCCALSSTSRSPYQTKFQVDSSIPSHSRTSLGSNSRRRTKSEPAVGSAGMSAARARQRRRGRPNTECPPDRRCMHGVIPCGRDRHAPRRRAEVPVARSATPSGHAS
mmetsp:Transcript_45149/g.144621  ORF Transcript_45149/g.144621 Transcript_45149/m.144621 type:complete len:269 (+) Transcript_45149:57-863(+)